MGDSKLEIGVIVSEILQSNPNKYHSKFPLATARTMTFFLIDAQEPPRLLRFRRPGLKMCAKSLRRGLPLGIAFLG